MKPQTVDDLLVEAQVYAEWREDRRASRREALPVVVWTVGALSGVLLAPFWWMQAALAVCVVVMVSVLAYSAELGWRKAKRFLAKWEEALEDDGP